MMDEYLFNKRIDSLNKVAARAKNPVFIRMWNKFAQELHRKQYPFYTVH